MQDEFYRVSFKPEALTMIRLVDILEDQGMSTIYYKGAHAYTQGVDFRNCPEILDSLNEHLWQKGWDNQSIGNVNSIASFERG